MAKTVENLEIEQLSIFQFSFFDEETEQHAEETSVAQATETPEELVSSEFKEQESIIYRGEQGVYLHPYSQEHRTSSIRVGNSYIVVLTSAIERE